MFLTVIQSTAASQVYWRLQVVPMAQYPVCMKYLLQVSVYACQDNGDKEDLSQSPLQKRFADKHDERVD